MNILVLNCGSSSLTFKAFAVDDSEIIHEILSGKANRVGVKGTEPSSMEIRFESKTHKKTLPIENHRGAAALAFKAILGHGIVIHCIGHRFVHGGSYFKGSTFIDKNTFDKLNQCQPLAPIHNPVALSVIREAQKFFPDVPHYVVFDSAFHHSLPSCAYVYAVPKRLTEKFGFRKYGFHGISYSGVTEDISRLFGGASGKLKVIACHLGTGGSSVAAIKGSRSLDTSMGYSPLQGLMMSTRCGDIDPMLAIYLMTVHGYRSDDLMEIFSKKSGILGVSGFSSDIRDIIKRISDNEEDQADLALNMYIHRLRKYIGAYVAVLGGVDVLAFTDDIGVHNWLVRERVCEEMGWCGVKLDTDLNRQAVPDAVTPLQSKDSKAVILSIPTREELVICREGVKLLKHSNDIAF